MAKISKKYKCHLLPFKKKDIVSVQEAKEKAGWEITSFNLPKMWQYSQGEGVVVAVLDCGIALSHPDLVANLVPGYNFISPKRPPEADGCEHGTHVAGIICATDNEIGMIGVAPKAKVMPIKVLDEDGAGDILDVARGIRWAVKHGADLICMSLGCPSPIQQVRKAIQFAQRKKVVCFCAAGNAGSSVGIYFPSSYKETISVASVDKNFNRATFSNVAPNLDFFAPGVDILSTVPPDWYNLMSGTSQASPWICGVAALLLSYVRKTKSKIKLETADDYRAVLKKYSSPIVSKDCFGSGFGLIHPERFEELFQENNDGI